MFTVVLVFKFKFYFNCHIVFTPTVVSVGPESVLVVTGMPVVAVLQEVIHSLCAVDIHFYNLAQNATKHILVTTYIDSGK